MEPMGIREAATVGDRNSRGDIITEGTNHRRDRHRPTHGGPHGKDERRC
jgi:hypothetical protein